LLKEFVFEASEGEAVGVIWSPPPGTARGCVLLCHGGSGHKLAPDIVATAEFIVARCMTHVVAIDGPVHGQNSPYPDDRERVIADFRQSWRDRDGFVDRAVADWSGAIATIIHDDAVITERLGWYGVSMGTAYGIPLLAQTPLVATAILGMWSLDYPHSERVRLDAPLVMCSVQFHVRTEDQLFSVPDQISLFEMLGTGHKELLTYPGPHAAPGPAEMVSACDFLATTLARPVEG
jgi:pimeloyl-ACP methyl ester carboxylesterase